MRQNRLCRLFLIIISLLMLSGCAHVRHAVPENLVGKAVVIGMPDIRYYTGKSVPPFMQESLANSFNELNIAK